MLYHPRTVAAIATASLLAAFAAQANKGAEYKPHHQKEHHKNFFLTGGATYLEPSFNGLGYATTVFHSAAPGSIPEGTTVYVDPEFNWGYFIQAGYRISHHYDVQGSWAQYNSRLNDSTTQTADGIDSYELLTSNGNVAAVPSALGESATALSKQNLDYSVFDINLGQYHDITEMLRARLFAGVRYAQVNMDIDNVYYNSFSADVVTDSYDSFFSGVGPEVGVDLEYKIWHTFGVVGHLAAAFLVGQQEASSVVYDEPLGAEVSNVVDTVARLVPGMDAKLGLNWNVPYAYEATSFGIEAGYQIAYYWDVIDQVQFGASKNEPMHNHTNYGNMGPYLNFTAIF